jgi:signal transduction histidine kinase
VRRERDNPAVTWSPRVRANLGLLVIGSAGLAYVFAALAIIRGSGATTTYAGRSPAAAWCFVTAGLALIAAGLFVLRSRPRTGALSVFAGVLWFAPVWEGWEGGPALIRTIGMLTASFVFPVLIHLVLAATGPPMTRAAEALIGLTYLGIGLCAVGIVLIRDPYLDPYCWANCTTNVFDVASQPELARQVGRVQLGITAVSAVALTVMCALRLAKVLSNGARQGWAVLPGAILLGATTAAYCILRWHHPLEDPSRTNDATVFSIRSVAVMLVAFGVAALLLEARRRRGAVGRIVATLDQAPPVGALGSALARALGDPSLRICYWLPASEQYVDAHGRPVPDPSKDTSSTATPLVRNGQTVAVIAHHSDPANIARGLGPAVRLALDNERLQADMLTRKHELADSRARIVEAADVRRRSLERDLHDGAQQSLLGLSYDLRLARSTAVARGDHALAAALDSAIGDISAAFGELRDLAHGIFPAALSAAGLGAGVASLATSAALPVDVDSTLDERLPLSVETAGYAVVASGLDAAVNCSAHRASVSLSRHEATLVVGLTHDGSDSTPDLVQAADRVGAVGGRLDIAPNRITAEIPCAS